MALTVADVLKKFKENKVSNNTHLLVNQVGMFIESKINERACVAVSEMTVDKKDLSQYFNLNYDIKPEGKIKILVILLASSDFNYYNCLTVENFKSYAKKIKDKDEFVCIAMPERQNYYKPVLSVGPDIKQEGKDEKFRKIIGEDIFHLNI